MLDEKLASIGFLTYHYLQHLKNTTGTEQPNISIRELAEFLSKHLHNLRPITEDDVRKILFDFEKTGVMKNGCFVLISCDR